jgi:hypothetical protein
MRWFLHMESFSDGKACTTLPGLEDGCIYTQLTKLNFKLRKDRVYYRSFPCTSQGLKF